MWPFLPGKRPVTLSPNAPGAGAGGTLAEPVAQATQGAFTRGSAARGSMTGPASTGSDLGTVPASEAPSEVIKTFEAVPKGKLVTGPGRRVPLADGRAEAMAGLDVTGGRCVLLVTPQSFGRAPCLDTRIALIKSGFRVVEIRRAAADVIAYCYASAEPLPSDVRQEAAAEEATTDVEATIGEIVQEAYDRGASDIHIVARMTHADVKFRITGELRFIRNLTKERALSLTRTLYTKAHTDSKTGSWQREIPKDSSIEWEVTKRGGTLGEKVAVQLRFSSGPLHPGDCFFVVMRLLTMEASSATLNTLGFEPEQQEMLRVFIGGSAGLVIICGPVNSGKSTTIQATLKEVFEQRGDNISVQTVEDPPEYIIPGACQMPVASAKQLEGRDLFNEAVKSKLRQDGDVVMIGEIRDGVTAKTVTDLVLAGRKLLTTLHAYSGLGVFLRLREMGVPWDVLTTSGFLHGIIYQRLVPQLCPRCSVSLKDAADRLKQSLLDRVMEVCDLEAHNVRVRGDGCAHCKSTGYTGRTVVAEFVVPDRPFLRLLGAGQMADAEAYWHSSKVLSLAGGLGVTALAHAIHKMRQGQIDPHDVERNVAMLTSEHTMQNARSAGAEAASSVLADAGEGIDVGGTITPMTPYRTRRRGM